MSEEKLRLLFRKQKENCGSRTDSCPGDDHLARLVAPDTRDENLAGLKAHVADCACCASRLAEALRQPAAARHVAHNTTAPGLRAVAAVAALAFVAGTLFLLPPGDGTTSNENSGLRVIHQPQAEPSLIFPAEGQVVSPVDMTVRWTPVADALHYSVRIVDDYGRIIVDSFADTPEYALPSNVRLAPGVSYYVKVDAYVMGDKAVSASHIYFTVAD